MKPVTNIDDPRYVKALAHPLRVRILGVLEERTASPIRIAEILDADIGVVSYHVRLLAKLGLIELVKETRRRGAIEHHYRAHERPTVSDEAWASASPVAKQALAAANAQQIHTYVMRSIAEGGFSPSDAHMTRTGMRLDQRGWEDLAAAYEHLLERMDEIEGEARQRLERDGNGSQALEVGSVLMLFHAARLSDDPPPRQATPKRADAQRRRRRTRQRA